MNRIFTKAVFFALFLFVFTGLSFVNASFNKNFGGIIVNDKAVEIEALEDSNFMCIVPGKTITIYPFGSSSPVSFLIPYGTMSATRTNPSFGQEILGLYSVGRTAITCIYKGYPPFTTSVSLNNITYFGTSKQ